MMMAAEVLLVGVSDKHFPCCLLAVLFCPPAVEAGVVQSEVERTVIESGNIFCKP